MRRRYADKEVGGCKKDRESVGMPDSGEKEQRYQPGTRMYLHGLLKLPKVMVNLRRKPSRPFDPSERPLSWGKRYRGLYVDLLH